VHAKGDIIRSKVGDRIATGKEPVGRGWGQVQRTVAWWEDILSRHPEANIGLCLGPGRGPGEAWLVDIEGDGPEAEDPRAVRFGGEVTETLGWPATRGHHQAWIIDGDRLDPILSKLKGFEGSGLSSGVYKLANLPGLELRLGGYKEDWTVKQVQSVVPP